MASSPAEIQEIAKAEYCKSGGLAQMIKNALFSQKARRKLILEFTTKNSHVKQSIDAEEFSRFEENVRIAQLDLEALMQKRMERMSKEFHVPLVSKRSKTNQKLFLIERDGKTDINISTGLEKCFKISDESITATGFYSDEDLFEAISKTQLRKFTDNESVLFSNIWSTCNSSFQTLTVEDFQFQFAELGPTFCHFGADDEGDDESFEIRMNQAAEKIFEMKSTEHARRLAKQGFSATIRAQMWTLIIHSDLTLDIRQYAREQCCHLKAQISRYKLLTDIVIVNAAKECKDDDNYFVFEEMIQEILLLFSQDEWVRENTANSKENIPDEVMKAEVRNKMKGKWGIPPKAYPPNGIVPFCNLPNYAMIVTFLFQNLDSAYIMFRELYSRYFFNLHTISTHSNGIMSLCVTFETLLKQLDPILYLRLTHDMACPPITYAFRWLMLGFVGVLDSEQVLILWDRILGYDRMEILSAVAAAIFVFRREKLMSTKSEHDIEIALSDLAMIKVIPLIQHYFFLRKTQADNLQDEWQMFTTALHSENDDKEHD
ncbi:hypothetical protein HK100_010460 [Physocladia obscura]|uniref:Rab-GAP TBC domain-containing protein n=1 Tax=Physocladia obscura TaxID=109957 RepID=A0AAD5T2A6_9FUNG|nr:hypothetical protein HK100_010460 [Physocladia obscura]